MLRIGNVDKAISPYHGASLRRFKPQNALSVYSCVTIVVGRIASRFATRGGRGGGDGGVCLFDFLESVTFPFLAVCVQ